MIISHRHKFIFVHCRKVAGSSIKVLLARHLGTTDICIGAHEDRAITRVAPNMRFWIDAAHPVGIRQYWRCIRRRKRHVTALNEASKRKYKSLLGHDPVHPSAEAARKHFSREWSRYFKFCFVRNPYERAVSDYYFRLGPKPAISFGAFLEGLECDVAEGRLPRRLVDNWPIYTIEDVPAVDFIGRYESLSDGLGKVLSTVGLPTSGDLPRAKQAEPYDYRRFYGPREIDVASRLYANEIEYFGYAM